MKEQDEKGLPPNNDGSRNDYLETCIDSFKKYLPKRITEKILSNPYNVNVEAERRFVTILFGDISGFTALSERLDPEDVIRVINKYFKKMVRIVDKYGGDVDKFVGDAVIVVFGAPVAHEDDPERAVRAALEMQKEMATIEPVWANGEYVKVTMHIGINTGEVVALNMGVADRMEYTVMGDNVNLTARLEAVAGSGEIIIPDRTYKYVGDIFDVDVLDPVSVKGKKEPIQIYRVKGVKDKVKDEDVYKYIADSSVIDAIEEKINGFTAGQAFSLDITGGPGSGKTKTVSYITDRADRKNLLIFSFHGSTFTKEMPFTPIKEFASSVLRVKNEDSETTLKDRIDNIIPEQERNGFYHIFGIGADADISLNELISSVVISLRALLRSTSEGAKSILIFEDTDTYDKQTSETIKRFYETESKESSYSFIFTSRSVIKLNTEWSIRLEAMDKHLMRELIRSRLEGREPDEKLTEFILKRTEGNPRFSAETVKHLVENDMLHEKNGKMHLTEGRSIKIPDSLKSIMLEKIDKLDEEKKLFLQYASILGREFSLHGMTEHLKYERKDAESYLKFLTLNGYIQFINDDRYSFPSDLLYETVYNSLTIRKRKSTHNEIAGYIENRYTNLNSEQVHSVSYHYDMAENQKKAPVFLRLAGKADLKLFSYETAISKYRKALSYYRASGEKTDASKAAVGIVSIYGSAGKIAEGLKFAMQEEESIERGSLDDFYLAKGILFDKQGDFENAAKAYADALAIAEESKNETAIQKIQNSMGILSTAAGNYNAAIEHFRKSLEVALKRNDMAHAASVYSNLGRVFSFMGDTASEMKHYETALDVFRERGDKNNEMTVLTNMGAAADTSGNQQAALENYEKALSLSIETHNLTGKAKILNNMANIYLMTGRVEEAKRNLKEVESIYSALYDRAGMAEVSANIAEIEMMQGNFLPSKTEYEKSLSLCRETGHKHLYLYASVNYAKDLIFLGYLQKADDVLKECIEESETMKIPEFTAMAVHAAGKMSGLAGKLDEEREMLQRSAEIFVSLKNPDMENAVRIDMAKAMIEMKKYDDAVRTILPVYDYAGKSGNEMLASDALATLTDCYLREERHQELAEAAAKAFELAERTDNRLILLRVYITLTRYYLICGDTTSGSATLKSAAKIAESSGSIEHQIITAGLSRMMHKSSGEDNLLLDSALKQIIAIEKYLENAEEKYYGPLMFERGFAGVIAECVSEIEQIKGKEASRILERRNARMLEDSAEFMKDNSVKDRGKN